MKTLPIRKPTRLKGYDYNNNGAYFLTVCVEKKDNILGEIVVVGDGALDVPYLQLSYIGTILDRNINLINQTYRNIKVDKYVIMPNRFHMIVLIHEGEKNTIPVINGTLRTRFAGCRGRHPLHTNAVIPRLISMLKRFVNKECGFSIFQRSYHDHIIRNSHEYKKIWQYIDTNIEKWNDDCFYNKA